MNGEIVLLLSVVGSVASIGGLLAAALQTIRLRKIKERAEADLWESIGVIREIVTALTAGEIEAAIVSATHLRSHLIKEIVLQQLRTDSRKLTQWAADGKLTNNEIEIAKQFTMSEPLSLRHRLGTVAPSQRDADRKSVELLEVISGIGITDAPEIFPSDLISKGIAQAQKKVKIATTWIHSLPLQLALAKTAKNCDVEILLLDPDSIAASQRSTHLEYSSPEEVPNRINETLSWLNKVFVERGKSTSRFKIGLYQIAPTFLMYLFDDTLVYCLALHGDKAACSRRQFVVKGEATELYKVMEEQFLLMSKRSRFIDLTEWPPNPAAQTDGSAAA